MGKSAISILMKWLWLRIVILRGKNVKWNVWHVEGKSFKIVTKFFLNFLQDPCEMYLSRRPERGNEYFVALVWSYRERETEER